VRCTHKVAKSWQTAAMIRFRTASMAASVLALTGLLATPAHAQTRAEQQVESFFSQYRDAVLGEGGQSPLQVEKEFLTPELIAQLNAWAQANNADPVFRAQDVPSNWSLKDNGSGAGHTSVIVSEAFGSGGGGSSKDVWYELRLADLIVNNLQDPPV
jgi:hypothetical protein